RDADQDKLLAVHRDVTAPPVRDSILPTVTTVVIDQPRARPSGTVALRNARIITMKGDEVIDRGDIVLRDDRIVAVGKSGSVTIPAGAKVIDVTGNTIVPGFVDLHAHWRSLGVGTLDPRPWPLQPRSWALESALAYGITTGREPQASPDLFTYADMQATGALL